MTTTAPTRHRPVSSLTSFFVFVVGSITVFLFFYGVPCSVNQTPTATNIPDFSSVTFNLPKTRIAAQVLQQPECTDGAQDPPNSTYYDDPDLSYSIDKPMKNWDEKRKNWLEQHPWFLPGIERRVLMVTGSQAGACKNPIGDHLLLRFFKNKVDYCRIHGFDLFYNNALLHPKMSTFWAKLPVIRSAMIAHPETEWIWWVDADAAFTDMEFKPPLKSYKDYNLILDGWENLLYDEKKWVSVNAGIFIIRNCQWSMDFMQRWASMGPQSPEYKKWGKLQRETLKEKLFPDSDDQGALIYLMLKEKKKWNKKILLEHEYSMNGYWEGVVDTYKNVTDYYLTIEKGAATLRRRHAEKLGECYGALRERYRKLVHEEHKKSWKRPFITHFAGCSPCSGEHNPTYEGDTCAKEMNRALNFADSQVLRSFGFTRHDLLDPKSVYELPFDFPA